MKTQPTTSAFTRVASAAFALAAGLVMTMVPSIFVLASPAMAQSADAELCLSAAPPEAIATACTRALDAVDAEEMDMADFLVARAGSYAALKELDKAITDLSTALVLTPNYYYANVVRGLVYHEQEDYDRAIADYGHAITFYAQTNYHEVYLYRGRSHAALGNLRQALADFDQAVGMGAHSAEIFTARGGVHFQLDNYELSLADFEQSLALGPANPAAIEEMIPILKHYIGQR